MNNKSSLPTVLTLEEAARYLRISIEELKIELENKFIPALKIAGTWRIKLDTLEKLLNPTYIHLHDNDYVNVNQKNDIEEISDSSIPSNVDKSLDGNAQLKKALPSSEPRNIKNGNSTFDIAPQPKEEIANFSIPDKPINTELPLPNDLQLHNNNIIKKVRGELISYHDELQFGHAKLSNNTRIWIEAKNFLPGEPAPKLGDTLEFGLKDSVERNCQEAIAIKIIPSEKQHIKQEKHSNSKSVIKPENRLSTRKVHQKILQSSKYSSEKGTPESEKLYQKAALARTEGRDGEARRFFRQAIEVGADIKVYIAFFKMEVEKGSREEAERIIKKGIQIFPSEAPLYVMYGHMQRRQKNYKLAESVFREGLEKCPHDINLRWGLGQTLTEVSTRESLQEAGRIFLELDKQGKLNKGDRVYLRFKVLQGDPLAGKIYQFFQNIPNTRLGFPGQRNPLFSTLIADGKSSILIADISHSELKETFGLDGTFIIQCFNRNPKQIDISNLTRCMRLLNPQSTIGLQDGREVVINSSLAFIAVPNSDTIRDIVMSILSESNEAIVPLDESIIISDKNSFDVLRDVLGQYIGMRDLYNSTLPVSGRRFFGREKLLVQLSDEVQQGHFIGIYGLRKMGKTSLIYQLRDEKLRGEAVGYVDLQASSALSQKNFNSLYWELEHDLYNRLHKHDKDAANLLRLGQVERFSDLPEHGRQAGLIFAEDLRSLLDSMSTGKVSNFNKIVIVLDELERILPIAGQPGVDGYLEFFGLLRGLAQTERYRGLLSSVVVAANAAISERGYWEGKENPVFALYKPIFLSPLSKDDCVDMIRTLGKGMSVYWTDDAIEMVFSETAGHPFLTRLLCSRIAKKNFTRPLTVTINMVENEIDHFIRDEGDKLEQITELLHTHFPKDEKQLERIALNSDSSEFHDEALCHLLCYQLIFFEKGKYQVSLKLLSRWLRRRAGIKE